MKYFGYSFLALLISCSTFLNNSQCKGLRFIGDANFKTEYEVKNTPFGGLSGLQLHPRGNRLIVVSDDRSEFSSARIYPVDLKIEENKFDVKPLDPIFLSKGDGTPFKEDEVDFEGIAVINKDFFILSSEGSYRRGYSNPPMLGVFNSKGRLIQTVSIPKKFIPNTKKTKGIRSNLGFESLALSQDGQYLFTASEQALRQDGELSKKEDSPVRIIRYIRSKGKYHIEGEYVYNVSHIPLGDNGIVDFIVLDSDHLIAIERAWIPSKRKQVVKLFKIDLTGATNVSKFDSLKNVSYKPVTKRLFVDLDDFLKDFSKGYQSLDNIEGIALGPKLMNGNHTLILVSDNNFNKKQRTQFLAFEILR